MSTVRPVVSQLPARLSPTALERYRRCPKMFFLSDIERRPHEAERSPALAQGLAVHDALKQFFGLPSAHRHSDVLHRCLRAVWPHHRSGAFLSRDEEIAYGREALRMLDTFAASFDLDARPISREQWVSLRTTTGTRIIGRVDRIDERGDGVEVIDYKTGCHVIDEEDLRQETAAWVYVLGTAALTRRNVERVRLLYLREGVEVVWAPEPEDLELTKERLLALLRTIARDRDFAAVPGTHCNWCPFRMECRERDAVSIDDLTPPEDFPF